MVKRIVSVLAIAACDGGPHRAPNDGALPTPDADPYTQVVEVPVTPNRDLDILFVVDDSPSMLDKQANLRANFPNFINVLSSLPDGLPNLHLGVVTTDMGTRTTNGNAPAIGGGGTGSCSGDGKNGALQIGQSGGAVSGSFISDIQPAGGGPRQMNYSGDLAAVFGQMASVGASGCGFEQPLRAMKAALGPNVSNQGFLRANALLAVVFLTDEDDCSMKDPAILGPESPALGPLQSFRCTRFGVTCTTGGATEAEMNQIGTKDGCSASTTSQYLDPVGEYHDFLVGLKGDARRVIVAGIQGPSTPFAVEQRTPPGGGTPLQAIAHSCQYQGAQGPEVADPATRLEDFLSRFPDRSTFATICQQDLSDALNLVGQLAIHSIGTPCVSDPLPDSNPNTAGDQYDCLVEDVVGSTATAIAACPGGPPCWHLVVDAANCPQADHLSLVVDRGGVTPDPATVTRMKCKL